MGLAIDVGTLAWFNANDAEGGEWIRKEAASIDAVLRKEGLGGFVEPETMPAVERNAVLGFPYSFLHYLRRAYAYVHEEQTPPDEEAITAEHERVVEDASTMFSSHLLCHSDCEGYYVPVDFVEPIFGDRVPGAGMLGSTQGLLRELRAVAPAIGIALTDGAPTPDALAELKDVVDEGPFWRERIVWWALFGTARISVRHGSLIVFQ